METFLVGEPLEVGLDDRITAFPQVRSQCMQRITSSFSVAALQMLKGIDRFDLLKEIMEPLNAAFWFAFGGLFDEFSDLVLAE
jgi:hypothetical protein